MHFLINLATGDIKQIDLPNNLECIVFARKQNNTILRMSIELDKIKVDAYEIQANCDVKLSRSVAEFALTQTKSKKFDVYSHDFGFYLNEYSLEHRSRRTKKRLTAVHVYLLDKATQLCRIDFRKYRFFDNTSMNQIKFDDHGLRFIYHDSRNWTGLLQYKCQKSKIYFTRLRKYQSKSVFLSSKFTMVIEKTNHLRLFNSHNRKRARRAYLTFKTIGQKMIIKSKSKVIGNFLFIEFFGQIFKIDVVSGSPRVISRTSAEYTGQIFKALSIQIKHNRFLVAEKQNSLVEEFQANRALHQNWLKSGAASCPRLKVRLGYSEAFRMPVSSMQYDGESHDLHIFCQILNGYRFASSRQLLVKISVSEGYSTVSTSIDLTKRQKQVIFPKKSSYVLFSVNLVRHSVTYQIIILPLFLRLVKVSSQTLYLRYNVLFSEALPSVKSSARSIHTNQNSNEADKTNVSKYGLLTIENQPRSLSGGLDTRFSKPEAKTQPGTSRPDNSTIPTNSKSMSCISSTGKPSHYFSFTLTNFKW